MKLRHLRVLRNTGRPVESESPKLAGCAEDARSIRQELQRCRGLLKQQRIVIAKYEMVLRRQRRLASISYTITLGVLVFAGLAVAKRFGWLDVGWLDLGRFVP